MNANVWVEITVTDGRITNVRDSTDIAIPTNLWRQYCTIDSLFVLIKSIESNSNSAIVRQEYDPTFGFPRSIFLDPKRDWDDEEYGYQCRNLVRLN